jgi:lysophospholipase L1-like esterase
MVELRRIKYFSLLIFNLLCIPCAFACPLIDGLVDFNCDGQHKILVIGDSVVRGIRDTRYRNNGGYVRRLKKKFPSSTIVNFGLPGYTTEQILSSVKEAFAKTSEIETQEQLLNADLLIIDEGRNDFFEDATPGLVVRNIKRLVTFLNRKLSRNRKSSAPFIQIATLLPTTRGYQRDYINAVNELLLELNSSSLPIGLLFHTLPDTVISYDGLHPDSKGYTTIAKYAAEIISSDIQLACLAIRPDEDTDGIYDKFEKPKYRTDANLTDTDVDGLNDGEEVFTYLTNPLKADTDDDGALDGAEVIAGTNPLTSN